MPLEIKRWIYDGEGLRHAFEGRVNTAALVSEETQRICQCGACSTAHDLTLKIVSHYGEITPSHIKDHVKLFGKDVITVHRLLKNDIAHHEYALFTQALAQEWPQATTPAWGRPEAGSQDTMSARSTTPTC